MKLNGDGTATVTSPQTTAAFVATGASGHPAACYTGAGASGMSAQTVNLSGISVISVQNDGTPPPVTPALAHGSSGWPVTGQYHGATAGTSNSVFYLTATNGGTPGITTSTAYAATAADKPYTPAVGDNPSSKTDKAWTPQWTSFTSGTTCSTATALTDLKFFNCYQSGGTYSATRYSSVKATVQAALAAAPSSYTTASALQTYLTGVLAAGNSADANNSAPSNADNTSHRWRVSVSQDAAVTDGCTPGTVNTGPSNSAISPPSSDPFYSSVAGNTAVSTSAVTTCLTATVTLQVGTCNVALVLGLCVNLGNYVWGNGTALLGGDQSVAQFKVTTTNVATTTTTNVTPAVSSFPNMDDVTQYALGNSGTFGTSGPGDLYVEGTNPTTIALHAQDDVVVTGTLAPTSGLVDAQTPVMNPTAAMEVIGQNNVRIYHPVKCVVTTAALVVPTATSPGFCPDDLTGLYTTIPATGYRPYQQYTNLRTDLSGLSINAAVFALGQRTASTSSARTPAAAPTVRRRVRGRQLQPRPVSDLAARRRHRRDVRGAPRPGRRGVGGGRHHRPDPAPVRLHADRHLSEPQDPAGRVHVPAEPELLDQLLAVARGQHDRKRIMSALWPFYAAVALLGAVIGSFLNVVIYRVPREESSCGRARAARTATPR